MSKKVFLKRSFAEVVRSGVSETYQEPAEEEPWEATEETFCEGVSVITPQMCAVAYTHVPKTDIRQESDRAKAPAAKKRRTVKPRKTPRFFFTSQLQDEEDDTEEQDGTTGKEDKAATCTIVISSEGSSDDDSLPDIMNYQGSRASNDNHNSKSGHCKPFEKDQNKQGDGDSSCCLSDSSDCESQNPHQDYFQGDNYLPVYPTKETSTGIKTKDAVKILLMKHSENVIARNIPNKIDRNVSFLYSINAIGHWKNALCDNMGVWKQNGKYDNDIFSDETGNYALKSDFRFCNSLNLEVIRRKFTHSNAKDLHRIVITLREKKSKSMLDLMFVQYYFNAEERDVIVATHRNTKRDNHPRPPYKRTLESTKLRIKELCKANKTPKDIFNSVIEEQGGLEHVTSSSTIPKNTRQIHHYNSQKNSKIDPIIDCSHLAKGQEHCKDRFVREVRSAPEFSIFLANDRQLQELEKFCTKDEEFSVLGIDTTFNIGKFYVTISTYRNLLFITEKNVEPVMIGPILIHQKKTFDSYFKLTSSILQEKPNLKNLKVFGTDGDVNLSQACEVCFTKAEHLLCDIHMYDNIQRKLKTLGIVGNSAKTVINDIFGIVCGDTKTPGLVDCTSEQQFDEVLATLHDKWSQCHVNGARFVQYFTEHKARLIKNCMTANVRAACGLGFPPKPYTQNANECINSILKSDIKSMKENKAVAEVDPYECVQIIEKVVKRQENNVKLSLIGKGPYTLKPEYQHLYVDEDIYWRKNSTQRDAVYQRALKEPVTSRTEHGQELIVTDDCLMNTPTNVRKEMKEDAFHILSDDTNIVPMPGSNRTAYLVYDAKCKDTRTVKANTKSMSFSCENKKCHLWNSVKLCPHILSVAEKLDVLEETLQQYKKKGEKFNMTNMSNTAMSANRGKKGVKSTQVRKGRANKPRNELVDYKKTSDQQPKKDCVQELKSRVANETQKDPFELTFIHGIIKTCYGCNGHFDGTNRMPPFDIIIKHLEIRPRYDKENKKWYAPSNMEKSNAYYHPDLNCVKRIHKDFDMNQLKLPLHVENVLTEEHKNVLRLAGKQV